MEFFNLSSDRGAADSYHSVATNYSMCAEDLVSSLVSILSRTRPHESPIQSWLPPCSGGRLHETDAHAHTYITWMYICVQHITSYVRIYRGARFISVVVH